jgi:hypothetical protein
MLSTASRKPQLEMTESNGCFAHFISHFIARQLAGLQPEAVEGS